MRSDSENFLQADLYYGIHVPGTGVASSVGKGCSLAEAGSCSDCALSCCWFPWGSLGGGGGAGGCGWGLSPSLWGCTASICWLLAPSWTVVGENIDKKQPKMYSTMHTHVNQDLSKLHRLTKKYTQIFIHTLYATILSCSGWSLSCSGWRRGRSMCRSSSHSRDRVGHILLLLLTSSSGWWWSPGRLTALSTTLK